MVQRQMGNFFCSIGETISYFGLYFGLYSGFMLKAVMLKQKKRDD